MVGEIVGEIFKNVKYLRLKTGCLKLFKYY